MIRNMTAVRFDLCLQNRQQFIFTNFSLSQGKHPTLRENIVFSLWKGTLKCSGNMKIGVSPLIGEINAENKQFRRSRLF